MSAPFDDGGPAFSSMESAPRDGTTFEARFEGDDSIYRIRWAEQRQCMLAGVGGGNGYFGPGWEDADLKLIADPPDEWREEP